MTQPCWIARKRHLLELRHDFVIALFSSFGYSRTAAMEDEEKEKNYLLDVLGYPFDRAGFPLFIVGSLLILASNFATILPVVGLFSVIFIFAYLSGLFFELVYLSAIDQDNLYCFPDLADPFEDILLPAVKVIAVVFISFAPLIAWEVWGDSEHEYATAIRFGLVGWAALYFPMAMLATVIFGTITGASPHIVLPGIFNAGPIYLVSVALIFGLYCLEAFSGSFLPEGIWGNISAAIIAMFVVMTTARTLGLLYLRREDELGWVYQRESPAR